MSTVDPIRSRKDIAAMKAVMHGRDLLLFTVGINTSLRISDLLELRFEHFENMAADRRVTVVEQKTGKTKTFFVNDAVLAALDAVPVEKRTGFLFPSRNGGGKKAITRVRAWEMLNEAAERAGLSHIKFGTHTMRKTFAYHAYNNGKGCDLALLMRILNHRSQKETLRYIGIEQQQMNEVYDGLNL